jgi:hypothetical protein
LAFDVIAVGDVVSTVILTAVEAREVLPAASVALAVISLMPAVKVAVVHENAPLPSAVQVFPVATPSTNNWTVELASAVPVTTRDVFLVIKSLLDNPASLPEVKLKVVGADGAVLSTIIVLFAPSELAAPGDGRVSVATLSAASLIVPVSELVPT